MSSRADERDAEQACGAVERGVDHPLEREVRLDRRFVEVVALLAHLLGIEAPIPRLDLAALAVRERQRLERCPLVVGARACRAPHLLEQRRHRALAARHRVAEREVGVARAAVQARLLETKAKDLGGDAAVVARAVVLAARRPRTPGGFAQVAPLGEGQERNDVRARQRDHRALGDAALARRLLRRGADERRQAGEIGLALEDQAKLALVGEHVLAESRRQLGEAPHDRRVARLLGRREPGAGADEVEVESLQDALLFRVEPDAVAPFVQCIDACEQRRVREDAAVVRCEQRRHLALHRLQRRRGLARREVVEQRADAFEQAAGPVERGDGVGEGRRFARCRERVDLGDVVAHRRRERGGELLGPDLREGRQAVGPRPGRQQRIGHFFFCRSLRSRSSKRRLAQPLS